MYSHGFEGILSQFTGQFVNKEKLQADIQTQNTYSQPRSSNQPKFRNY